MQSLTSKMAGLFGHQIRKFVPLVNAPKVGVKSVEGSLGLPEKPKKPLTPFFRYLREMRPQLIKKYPDSSPSDILKLAASLWKEVDDSMRMKLDTSYQSDLRNYKFKLCEYEEKLTPEQKSAVKEARQDVRERRSKRKLKRKMKELGKPKHPASGYALFIQARSAEFRGKAGPQWLRGVIQAWKELKPEEKEKYLRESMALKEKYRVEIAKWEEKMVESPEGGNSLDKEKNETDRHIVAKVGENFNFFIGKHPKKIENSGIQIFSNVEENNSKRTSQKSSNSEVQKCLNIPEIPSSSSEKCSENLNSSSTNENKKSPYKKVGNFFDYVYEFFGKFKR